MSVVASVLVGIALAAMAFSLGSLVIVLRRLHSWQRKHRVKATYAR